MEEHLFVSFEISIVLNRLIKKFMIPSKLTLTVGINLNENADETEVSDTMEKIRYWFDQYVSYSLVVSAQNLDALSFLIDEDHSKHIDNAMMLTPTEPTEQHLVHIFQAKINAIGNDIIGVNSLSLNSDETGMTFNYIGETENHLPKMEDWISGENWFDKPWWDRNDITIFDTLAPEGTDFSIIPDWAKSLENIDKPTSTIIEGEFEPKIVET